MSYNNSTYAYYLLEDSGYGDFLQWKESFRYYEKFLQQYLYAYFLLMGTLGNIPCALYLTKYCRTAWSVCFYHMLTMVFGLIELYIYCGNLWFLAVTGNNLTLQINILSNAVCKVYNFFINVLIYFLSWVTVATSIETMITVDNPQRMFKMCTLERARSIVLLIIVLVVCLNLHYFWTIGLSSPDTDPNVHERMCHNNYQPQLSDEVSLVLPLSEFLLDNFIPFILVSTFACISIKQLKKRRKNVTFELKKYIVDVEMLSQLRLPTIIMLSMFAILKGLQCVEHIMRFAQSQKLTYDYSNMFYLMKEIDCIQLVNFTMTYFYISFKPFLFIFMSKRLRVDITEGIYKIFYRCDLCRKSRYKSSHISPESSQTTTRTLMLTDKKFNGDMIPNIKCTNV